VGDAYDEDWMKAMRNKDEVGPHLLIIDVLWPTLYCFISGRVWLVVAQTKLDEGTDEVPVSIRRNYKTATFLLERLLPRTKAHARKPCFLVR